jgi:hypothetical protein
VCVCVCVCVLGCFIACGGLLRWVMMDGDEEGRGLDDKTKTCTRPHPLKYPSLKCPSPHLRMRRIAWALSASLLAPMRSPLSVTWPSSA